MASNTFNPYRTKAEYHNRHYGLTAPEGMTTIDKKRVPRSWNLIQNRYQMMDARDGLERAFSLVAGGIQFGATHITGQIVGAGNAIYLETLTPPPPGLFVTGPTIRFPYRAGRWPKIGIPKATCTDLWRMNPSLSDYEVAANANKDILDSDFDPTDCWAWSDDGTSPPYTPWPDDGTSPRYPPWPEIFLTCEDLWTLAGTPANMRKMILKRAIVIRTDGLSTFHEPSACFEEADLSKTCADFWRERPDLAHLQADGFGSVKIVNAQGRVVGDFDACWTDPPVRTCADWWAEYYEKNGSYTLYGRVGNDRRRVIYEPNLTGDWPNCWDMQDVPRYELSLEWDNSTETGYILLPSSGTATVEDDCVLDHDQSWPLIGTLGLGSTVPLADVAWSLSATDAAAGAELTRTKKTVKTISLPTGDVLSRQISIEYDVGTTLELPYNFLGDDAQKTVAITQTATRAVDDGYLGLSAPKSKNLRKVVRTLNVIVQKVIPGDQPVTYTGGYESGATKINDWTSVFWGERWGTDPKNYDEVKLELKASTQKVRLFIRRRIPRMFSYYWQTLVDVDLSFAYDANGHISFSWSDDSLSVVAGAAT
jgi:hypothetical protein